MSVPGGFLRRPHAYEYICVKYVAVYEYPALRSSAGGHSSIDESAAAHLQQRGGGERSADDCMCTCDRTNKIVKQLKASYSTRLKKSDSKQRILSSISATLVANRPQNPHKSSATVLLQSTTAAVAKYR